jgi:hypothetical protein
MKQLFEWKQATPDNLPKVNQVVFGREASGAEYAVSYVRRKEVAADFEEENPYLEEVIGDECYLKEGWYEILEDVPYYNTYYNRREIVEYLSPASPLPISGDEGIRLAEFRGFVQGLIDGNWIQGQGANIVIDNAKKLLSENPIQYPDESVIEAAIDENCGKEEDSDIPAFYFRMGIEWLKSQTIAGHQARDGEVEKLVAEFATFINMMGNSSNKTKQAAINRAREALKPYQSPVK